MSYYTAPWLTILLFFTVPAWATDIFPTSTDQESNGTCTTSNAHTTLDDDPELPGDDWCDATLHGSQHRVMLRFSLTGPLDNGPTSQQWVLFSQESNAGSSNDSQIQVSTYDGVNCADMHDAGAIKTSSDQPGSIQTWDFGGSDLNDSNGYICAWVWCTAHDQGPQGNMNSCDFNALKLRATYEPTGVLADALHTTLAGTRTAGMPYRNR